MDLYVSDIDYTSPGIAEYNEYFDKLDLKDNIYNTTKKLTLDTNIITRLPDNIWKFKIVKEIDIRGTRFWNMDMTQIPKTVEILHLTELLNVSIKCFNGMNQMENLQILYLNFDIFVSASLFIFSDKTTELIGSCDDFIPIPNLPKLKNIIFENDTDCYTDDTLKEIWTTILIDDMLFSKIKHRIISVEAYDIDSFFKVIIKLC